MGEWVKPNEELAREVAGELAGTWMGEPDAPQMEFFDDAKSRVLALLDEKDREWRRDSSRMIEEEAMAVVEYRDQLIAAQKESSALAARVVELESNLERVAEAYRSFLHSDYETRSNPRPWEEDEDYMAARKALSSPSPAVEAVREVLRATVRETNGEDLLHPDNMHPLRAARSSAVNTLKERFPALMAGLEGCR